MQDVTLQEYLETHDSQTVEWLNSPELSSTFGLTYRVTQASHRRWLNEQENLFVRAIMFKERHIGNASLRVFPRHNKASLEIYIGETDCHGQGMGKQVLTALLDYAFDVLKLHRVFLVTRTNNIVAESLYRSSGFVFEGCEREAIRSGDVFLDQNLWGILRQEWKARRHV